MQGFCHSVHVRFDHYTFSIIAHLAPRDVRTVCGAEWAITATFVLEPYHTGRHGLPLTSVSTSRTMLKGRLYSVTL